MGKTSIDIRFMVHIVLLSIALQHGVVVRTQAIYVQVDALYAQMCDPVTTAACTKIARPRLHGGCTAAGGTWQLHAIAEFWPVTFIRDRWTHRQDIRAHELDHIADIRGSLSDYVTALEQQTFADISSCEKALLHQQRSFKRVVAEAVQRSAGLRD